MKGLDLNELVMGRIYWSPLAQKMVLVFRQDHFDGPTIKMKFFNGDRFRAEPVTDGELTEIHGMPLPEPPKP